ncbi:ubiquitin-conjugating enzyme E2 J2 [Saprolegnia diclina VS20]|uniref:E2 ubiquitin-conjugating enzyme n=1 Tax=Saprolegnia diclina (strain VS20) TaxID=1156394 RepID=T0RK14_SAPDV|nr:ubiquitin-conjugating enzyme E2 J2 [Saprolegnia diclina VS20]EQC32618.1 ubiquitin-conjugating enzyme E2 J2 [Saprolegnia diclina VS20]|eukprot:XP_008614119.1 ubiquitin-conjugating enzyme E2 J2 [Saprolegnia diclina VS20]
MASAMATKRLRKEYLALRKSPEVNVEAVPLERNILEWHYVLRGIGVYEGGYYHGKLVFPPEYPMKPPSVYMLTPNGRFQTNKRLCLSMSDYHPETWNPMWSVSSILAGLYSFMNETTPTLGSITTTDAQKRKFALASLEENVKNPTFALCFPDLVAAQEAIASQQQIASGVLTIPSATADAKQRLPGLYADLRYWIAAGVALFAVVLGALIVQL